MLLSGDVWILYVNPEMCETLRKRIDVLVVEVVLVT